MKKILISMLFMLAMSISMVSAQGVTSVNMGSYEDGCMADQMNMDTWGVPAQQGGNYGGASYDEFCMVWEPGCEEGEETASVTMHLAAGDNILKIKHLDGMSHEDSFNIYIDDVLAATYTDNQDAAEIWKESYFTVNVDAQGDYEIKIEVIEDAWDSCDAWGQVAIDYIQVIPPNNDVPEFGALAALGVLALAGLYIYKRR